MGRMHERLNRETLQEVDCFTYMGSQVGTDEACEKDVVHKMNEGYIERGEC